ncbi:ABC transporter permease [Candidatus Sulfidibacterium hydrothermale]|uniref:ABC transporter permease n=1 Tax=Candidatus Sulfidibacterium hydrothermale TaxID=2875962 RepID=UPI001F0A41EA|nr:ABC transporter permease [Candidatus Sulfidibacterium hydrothermale]UBM63167.1 ABC transporter permease [Candidatus Sulfidibacterium hydrothermale]
MNMIIIVLKRLKSQKLTAWLRIISMGVGMASALVLFYVAWNELNTDNFYPEKNRIYEVFNNFKSPNYSGISGSLVQPLVPAMVTDFPQVKYGTVLFLNGKTTYKVKESLLEANTIYADSSFFKVFSRWFVAGKANRALQTINTAVVTRKFAKKLFGSSLAALNKVIYLNEVRPIVITGVIENWPPNASFQADVLISFATLKDEHRLYMGWDGGDSFHGYVKLTKNANPHEIEKEMPAFLRRHYNVAADEANGFYSKYELIPITKAAFIENPEKKMTYYIMIFIGILIFGLVCFNSLLLVLAGYNKFMKEIAIHRTLGASVADIQRFIFNEALFYMLSSTGIAILFLLLMNPFIEANFQFGLAEAFTNRTFLLLFLLLFVLAFLVIYFVPVRWSIRFFMTTQKTASFYKPPLNRNLQRALLTLQIGISVFLFIFLFFIYSQFNFIRYFNKGYNSDQLVYIELQNKPLYSKDKVIKSEILKIPNVLSACLSDGIPVWGLPGNGFSATPDGQKTIIVRNLSVDKDFFATLKMKLEGPGFQQNIEKNGVVISRKAAQRFGLQNPVGKTIYFWKSPMIIRGVVNDFVTGSLHSAMQPVVFNQYDQHSVYSVLTVRLAPQGIRNTVRKIKSAIQHIVPGQIVQVRFYNASLQANYQLDRAVKNTVVLFSILAALITLAGLVGFTLSMIHERTKELGIRKVNGASENALLLLLNKVFMWNIAIALVIFIPVSYQISKLWLQQYAYAVPMKWWVFVLVSVLITAAVLGVVSIFTIKAARKNPVEALRYE